MVRIVTDLRQQEYSEPLDVGVSTGLSSLYPFDLDCQGQTSFFWCRIWVTIPVRPEGHRIYSPGRVLSDILRQWVHNTPSSWVVNWKVRNFGV